MRIGAEPSALILWQRPYFSKIELLVWVRKPGKFSRATVQVNVAGAKRWEETNL